MGRYSIYKEVDKKMTNFQKFLKWLKENWGIFAKQAAKRRKIKALPMMKL